MEQIVVALGVCGGGEGANRAVDTYHPRNPEPEPYRNPKTPTL